MRRLAVEQRVVADAKLRSIGAGVGGIGFVFLDGPDVALRGETCCLKANRTGTGADVPDGGVGRNAQFGQRDGARFLFGDQALFGRALDVFEVVEAEGRFFSG